MIKDQRLREATGTTRDSWSGGAATRRLAVATGLAAAVILAAFVADLFVSPAAARLPTTIYVDGRYGDDEASGRSPQESVKTLIRALKLVSGGGQILLHGRANLNYRGTSPYCPILQGTARRPIVIRPDVYAGPIQPVVIAGTVEGPSDWVPVAGQSATWSAPFKPEVSSEAGIPAVGAVMTSTGLIPAYVRSQVAQHGTAAWTGAGRLFVRSRQFVPGATKVIASSALCVGSGSQHVRLEGFEIQGGENGLVVQPDAKDVRVSDVAITGTVGQPAIGLGSSWTGRQR